MTDTLKDFSNEIISKLSRNSLTRGDLNSFLHMSNYGLKEIYSFDNVEDYKNTASPFVIMLSNPNFVQNDYLWQTICARGYFISSYYIQQKILNEINFPIPEKLLDYVELLKVRLIMLTNGKIYFPDVVFRIPNNPNISKYWSPLSDCGMSDRDGFNDMVLSDAGLIQKYASSPAIRLFHQETLEFANSVLNDNSMLLRNSSIEEKINSGLKMHRLFFDFLNKTLERNNKIDRKSVV